MDFKLTFGVLSSLVAVVCFIPYLRDIFKKHTQPHAYSWLVWTILQIVGVTAQFADGAGYGAWGLTIGAFFCFTIFLLSFKYGTKNITKFDGACLAASLVATVAYLVLHNPLWAVIIVAVVDFVGFLPTFRKGWQEPNTETPSTFALSALANFFSLLALQNYTTITVLYIASLLVTNSSFVFMILLRKQILAR
jgi:hypothetical protein